MTKDEYHELPSWWLEFCPKNLDTKLCINYLKPPKWHWAKDENGQFIIGSKGKPYTVAEQYAHIADRLGILWYASEAKDRLGDHKHYKDWTDEQWVYNWSEEYFGPMPDNVYEVLRAKLANIKSELMQQVPDDDRWSWEKLGGRYPKHPEPWVKQIMEFLNDRPVETIHYVGTVDDELTKAIIQAGRYKLTILNMFDKYGYGYHFDMDLNLTHFGRPHWLEGIPLYSEGAPQLTDVWIHDCEWSGSDNFNNILIGRNTLRRPHYVILMGKAIEHGLHNYYQWQEKEGVYFGEIKDEFTLKLSKEEIQFKKKVDRQMHGEN